MPDKFKNHMKQFYEDKTKEEIQEIKDAINQFHQKNSDVNDIDVQKILKIQYIRPELKENFPELLNNAYQLFKNNDKFHRERKAKQKKERAIKHNVIKKLKKEHLEFIKDYMDDERNLDQICLKSLCQLIDQTF